MNFINKMFGRGFMSLLLLVALMSLLAPAGRAANFIDLKPDSAYDPVATVFGSPYKGVSIGTTTPPATSVRLYVYGDIVTTGTIISNASVSGSGQPTLASGAVFGTLPNVSTFTSAGVLQAASIASAGSIAGSSTVSATTGLSVSAGPLQPTQKTKAQLAAITPAVGDVYVCSDCTLTYDLVVGTGAVVNGFREVGTSHGAQ